MNPWEIVLTLGLFVILALLGIRATRRLWRRWAFNVESRKSLILLTLAAISTLITTAAGFYGIIALRRLLGFEPLPWTPAVSLVLAAAVLLIPALLDLVTTKIEKRPDIPNGDVP